LVTASLKDAARVRTVELRFQSIGNDPGVAETVVKMAPAGPNAPVGTFQASIPAQPAGRILRFRVRAMDTNELERYARTRGPSIRDDGLKKALAGVTTLEEVLRVTRSD
jgi:hypothetical protein